MYTSGTVWKPIIKLYRYNSYNTKKFKFVTIRIMVIIIIIQNLKLKNNHWQATIVGSMAVEIFLSHMPEAISEGLSSCKLTWVFKIEKNANFLQILFVFNSKIDRFIYLGNVPKVRRRVIASRKQNFNEIC